MELSEFISHFAEQFDETDPALFQADTEFHNLDEYSSLIALSLVAMADEEYGVTLKGDDVRNAVTIKDLFEAVKRLR